MCPLQRIGKVCLISSALCHPVSCLCHIRFFVLSCCFKYLCLIVFLLSVQIRSGFFCTLFYLYLCFSTFFCVCGVCEAVCVQTGVFRGPCGPLTWLGVQQESWSREQQHRGADGVLSPELVSIVPSNWIWSGRRDGNQWEAAIIRCEWDMWFEGWTHNPTQICVHTDTHWYCMCVIHVPANPD